MNVIKKTLMGAALASSAVVGAAPAQAHYTGYPHDHGGDRAALAIGAGVVGLAIGAAIASSNRSRYNDRYYDGYRGYYGNPYRGRYYPNGYYGYGYNGYYGDDDDDGYPYAYRSYQRCWTQRYYDDYTGRLVRVRRCD